jgi:gamma-glutamylcyclotransferase (GGCT)/AIG2-like uncharacterized protein YtfP
MVRPPSSPDDDGALVRLAAYGTLVPGGSNHHVVEHLGGVWQPVVLRGELEWLTPEIPRLCWHERGPEVPAQLLTSVALLPAWPVLDELEGDAYVRTTVLVRATEGVVPASCYVRPPGPGSGAPSTGGRRPPR